MTAPLADPVIGALAMGLSRVAYGPFAEDHWQAAVPAAETLRQALRDAGYEIVRAVGTTDAVSSPTTEDQS